MSLSTLVTRTTTTPRRAATTPQLAATMTLEDRKVFQGYWLLLVLIRSAWALTYLIYVARATRLACFYDHPAATRCLPPERPPHPAAPVAQWAPVLRRVMPRDSVARRPAEYDRFAQLLKDEQPDTLVHFAEQRAAPYSMKNAQTKRCARGRLPRF